MQHIVGSEVFVISIFRIIKKNIKHNLSETNKENVLLFLIDLQL